MKFMLVFVALFCLAYCETGFEEDVRINNSPDDQEFETMLENKEVPLTKKEDKDVNIQFHKVTSCLYCICSKPSTYGLSTVALCYRCYDKLKKIYRVCFNCYCVPRRYGIYDAFYAFCQKCLYR